MGGPTRSPRASSGPATGNSPVARAARARSIPPRSRKAPSISCVSDSILDAIPSDTTYGRSCPATPSRTKNTLIPLRSSKSGTEESTHDELQRLHAVCLHDLGIEARAVLWGSSLSVEIDVHDAEPLGIAVRPFEVVEQ